MPMESVQSACGKTRLMGRGSSKSFCSDTAGTSEKPCFYLDGVTRLSGAEKSWKVQNPQIEVTSGKLGMVQGKKQRLHSLVWAHDTVFFSKASLWHYFISLSPKQKVTHESWLVNIAKNSSPALPAHTFGSCLSLREMQAMEMPKPHPHGCALMLWVFPVLFSPILFPRKAISEPSVGKGLINAFDRHWTVTLPQSQDFIL